MLILAVLALGALAWLIYQLLRAKKFTRFKQTLEQEIKPKVVQHIIDELNETRSELFPNNEAHQQATIYYWCQYKSRILQAALNREIIDESWLKQSGNWRNSQHLFHVEAHVLFTGKSAQ
ncbi:hypothetical protein SG35_006440 [Thalassomonas actiniarum]|uniref:Uncharacterized protein n=1 Tax=Thalassomonas actiniarum TaxID=485447 RepID=A0AAF0C694_9GAMM|nr:hypothetical protein SG35_006440 [Thalassomonas actiniarum]